MGDGRFIVLEGLDGSGITTQTELLRTWCERRGTRVYVTKEPSEGPVGGIIKQALRHRLEMSPRAMALLFAGDREDHIATEILPTLASGATVISDRYYLSSFAYQLVEVPDLEWLIGINAHCRRPDLTVYLDVPAERCLERMTSDAWRGSDQLQLYEKLDLLKQVRENFMTAIARLRRTGQRIEIVDGTREVTQIGSDVLAFVTRLLGEPKLPPRATRQSSGSRQIAAILEGEPLPS